MKYWLPIALWMGLIFWFSARPTIPTSEIYWQDFTIKKTAHFVVYFVLGALIYRALKSTTKLSKPQCVFYSVLISGLYAVSDEVHQSFVPGRTPTFRDVGIDILGSCVAVTIFSRVNFTI